MPGKLIVDEIEDSGGTSVIGRKNYIINGNFDIWQRGTSLTGGGALNFLADRWQFEGSGAIYNLSRGTFTAGQTDVPNNPKYYLDITVTSADDLSRLEQNIEDVYTLAGETVTVSFWAKYTTTAPTDFNVYLVQKFGSGGSADVSTTLATGQTLTTSWQKFTFTTTLPSISGKTVGSGSSLMLRGPWNPNNETYDIQIAQVQVEKGSVATDFEVRPIGEELSLCERYYHNSDYGIKYHNGGAYFDTTEAKNWYILPTTMRTSPTVSFAGSGSDYTVLNNGSVITGTAISSSAVNQNGFIIDLTTAARTTGSATIFRWTASGRVQADAEL
jgi:hypothetical protein